MATQSTESHALHDGHATEVDDKQQRDHEREKSKRLLEITTYDQEQTQKVP